MPDYRVGDSIPLDSSDDLSSQRIVLGRRNVALPPRNRSIPIRSLIWLSVIMVSLFLGCRALVDKLGQENLRVTQSNLTSIEFEKHKERDQRP